MKLKCYLQACMPCTGEFVSPSLACTKILAAFLRRRRKKHFQTATLKCGGDVLTCVSDDILRNVFSQALTTAI